MAVRKIKENANRGKFDQELFVLNDKPMVIHVKTFNFSLEDQLSNNIPGKSWQSYNTINRGTPWWVDSGSQSVVRHNSSVFS